MGDGNRDDGPPSARGTNEAAARGDREATESLVALAKLAAEAGAREGGPAVTGLDRLSNSFLGVPVEICIVTRSLVQTMVALVKIGIGPWGLYQFNEQTVADRRSYGAPDPYVINVAFAHNGPIIWELMEPVSGAETLQRALGDREQALHHVAFDGSDLSIEERRAELLRRGCRPALSGLWLGRVPFTFFETPGLGTVVLESYVFPADFVPEPHCWYPGPPPGR